MHDVSKRQGSQRRLFHAATFVVQPTGPLAMGPGPQLIIRILMSEDSEVGTEADRPGRPEY